MAPRMRRSSSFKSNLPAAMGPLPCLAGAAPDLAANGRRPSALPRRLRLRQALDHRGPGLAPQYLQKIARFLDGEYHDRQIVVASEGYGRTIHHPQIAGQHLAIGQLL